MNTALCAPNVQVSLDFPSSSMQALAPGLVYISIDFEGLRNFCKKVLGPTTTLM